MKERPILFSAPMVRALLSGEKTQTRRVYVAKNGGLWPNSNDLPGMKQIMRNCPYGQEGDRLWVREAWRTDSSLNSKAPSSFSGWPVRYGADSEVLKLGAFYGDVSGKCRPSIHMPRWASRITLEIVSVRVERLQDISEQDAKAEGADGLVTETCTEDDKALLDLPLYSADPHRNGYALLWESLNGDGSWAENLWVWVVEFRRIES